VGDVFKRPGSPYWYADLTDPTAPRGRRRFSTKRRHKGEAREVARVQQAQIDATHATSPVGLTFSEAALRYHEDADLEDSTRRGQVSYTNKIVLSSLGDFDLATLTHEGIKRFINERRQEFVVPHNKPDAISDRRISDETLRRMLAFMSSVYRHAINHGLYEGTNPLATFDRSILAKKKATDRHLRERQVAEVIKALKPEPKRIVVVLALTGMRAGELINLQWRQVDLKKRIIDLENDQTKTNRSRVIPFDNTVRDALSSQKAALVKTHDYAPEGLVFPSPQKDEHGRRTKLRYSLAGILKSAKRSGKVKGYTNHRLRHSYASWLLQGDVDPIMVRDLLGHETLSTTTIYARHLSESRAKKLRQAKLPKLKVL
jgi:integrase